MQNVTELVNQQLDALLYEETDLVSNMANASALLNQSLDQINWVGFYRYVPENDELILGPFQGKVACMHIKNGVGVWNGPCTEAFAARCRRSPICRPYCL